MGQRPALHTRRRTEGQSVPTSESGPGDSWTDTFPTMEASDDSPRRTQHGAVSAVALVWIASTSHTCSRLGGGCAQGPGDPGGATPVTSGSKHSGGAAPPPSPRPPPGQSIRGGGRRCSSRQCGRRPRGEQGADGGLPWGTTPELRSAPREHRRQRPRWFAPPDRHSQELNGGNGPSTSSELWVLSRERVGQPGPDSTRRGCSCAPLAGPTERLSPRHPWEERPGYTERVPRPARPQQGAWNARLANTT